MNKHNKRSRAICVHMICGPLANSSRTACARCRLQPHRAYPKAPENKPHLHLSYKLAC